MREWEKERARGRQTGRKGDRICLVCLREGMGEVNQQGDRQREANNQLVHSDTLRIRTITDCNATHLLLCISFICLLKCTMNGLNHNHNGILCVCVCVCVCVCECVSV